MMEMHTKYDNMQTNRIFNALIFINNQVNLCINCMLSIIPIYMWNFIPILNANKNRKIFLYTFIYYLFLFFKKDEYMLN